MLTKIIKEITIIYPKKEVIINTNEQYEFIYDYNYKLKKVVINEQRRND